MDPSKKRLIAAVTTVLLILAGLGAWKVASTRTERDAATVTARRVGTKRKTRTERTKTSDRTPSSSSDSERTALAWARAAHEWGTDPAAVEAVAAGSDASALAALRPSTPDVDAFVRLYSADRVYGPDQASPYCTPTRIAACDAQPTMWDYWNANEYLMGARFTSGPTASVKADGTVEVKGELTTVLWTDADGAGTSRDSSGASWWAFTPVYNTYDIDETLTVGNGKVSGVDGAPDDWIAAPFLADWNGNPCFTAASRPAFTQQDTPMRGDPPSGRLPDRDTSIARIENSTDVTSGAWNGITPAPADTDQCGEDCDLSVE